MMKIRRILAVFLAAAVIIPQAVFANTVDADSAALNYEYFTRLMTYASQLYIDDDISAEELIDAAFSKAIKENPDLITELLKAGFSSLDEYSEYYTPKEYTDFVNNINHTFYGIGVVIQKKEDYVEVTNCLEGGAAFSAGIEAGDKIVSVDGVSAVKKTLSEVQSMVTGDLGTDVSVTVLRAGQEIDFAMKRAPVSDITVSYILLKGNIGYVRIINFAEKTSTEFAEVLKKIENDGVTNVILDLRDNPGGYLTSAIEIAKMIIPEGVVVQTMYRQEEKNEIYYSELKNPKFKFNVLVNKNTASAAEVLSGAMQDSGIGTLIGETTYGKAVIQEIFRMADGAFKLTTGHYLTRDGHEINKKGINPDEYIVNPTQPVDLSRYTPLDYQIKWKVGEQDNTIQGAKERLRRLRYYSGEINMDFDTALEEAVTRFQGDMGLFPYGVLDISTQTRLENEFSQTEEMIDRQFEAAYTSFGGKLSDLEE